MSFLRGVPCQQEKLARASLRQEWRGASVPQGPWLVAATQPPGRPPPQVAAADVPRLALFSSHPPTRVGSTSFQIPRLWLRDLGLLKIRSSVTLFFSFSQQETCSAQFSLT